MVYAERSSDHPDKAGEGLDLSGCADLLGVAPLRLWWWARTGQFIRASAAAGGKPRWSGEAVYRWAVASPFGLAGRVPLRYWPDATEPAEYERAFRSPHAVSLRWRARPGSVLMVWTLPDGFVPPRAELVDELPPADVVLQVLQTFVVDGPWVESYAPSRPSRHHGMRWSEISRVLGQPAPYWPGRLRLPELISAWKPGAEEAEAPALPDVDNAALLRLAAMYEPQHPTWRVLVNMARLAQDRSTSSAMQDVKLVTEMAKPETITVAARPMAVPEADRDDIDESTRRAGWLEMLRRRDTLAAQCIEQVMAWDGGNDLPFGNVEQITLNTPQAIEWASRLERVPWRLAHRLLGNRDELVEFLVDPITDAPVARRENLGGEEDTLVAASIQRLPTVSPLAEIILDDPIWVRTTDDTLFPVPQSAGFGPSWGYTGSGPGTLALLIDALLTDITAPAPNDINGAPPGLERLCQYQFPHGTVLTRQQLEAARRGHLPNLPDDRFEEP